MLNLFSKTTSWMLASLLATSVAITAQDNGKGRPQKSYEQGHEVAKNQLMPAYNAPACIDVRGAWDVYLTGSFLWWQAREDNLELGLATNGSPTYTGGANPFTPVNPVGYVNDTTSGQMVNPEFAWGPGFKIGIGLDVDYDGWDMFAEYTWFHKTSNTSWAPGTRCDVTTPEWLAPTQHMSTGLTSGADSNRTYLAANERWRLKVDLLDVSLARSYYQGTKLSVRPFFGARGAWIRQHNRINYSNEVTGVTSSGTTVTGTTSNTGFYNNQSRSTTSWGVGPRAGFESNWMLGYGVRLIGDFSGDILYTRYNAKSKNELRTTSTFGAVTATSTSTVTQKHLDMLRPHADLEMGFGWGSYFDNSNWHVDLRATYGYQVFWNQNMFRFFSDDVSARSTVPQGNLYIHGATFTARFDF